MDRFFTYPPTPHLIWLGKTLPRQDKLLPPEKVEILLADELVIEEKVDGANVGFSFNDDGNLLVQNRGNYLQYPFQGQFYRLEDWARPKLDHFFETLSDQYILFGEWCKARHSINYNLLPDWLLAFDIYDRRISASWLQINDGDFFAS